MKFTCEKKMLIDAVTNVSKAITERAPFPALAGMKMTLNKEDLELTGYNMEIGIKTNITVESSDYGQCIIDAGLFSNMLRKMPEDIVMIDVSGNYQVTVSSGVTTFNLVATSADEYPELPLINSDESITISQPVLKNMIEQSVFAVATTDMKPILKGELFEIEDGKLTLAAIDGYRLAVRSEPIKYDGAKKFVVPAITLSKVTELLSCSATMRRTWRSFVQHSSTLSSRSTAIWYIQDFWREISTHIGRLSPQRAKPRSPLTENSLSLPLKELCSSSTTEHLPL